MEKRQGYVEGKCPICGSLDLEYGACEHETGFLYYPVECKKCGAIGKEFYNIEFTDIEMEKPLEDNESICSICDKITNDDTTTLWTSESDPVCSKKCLKIYNYEKE